MKELNKKIKETEKEIEKIEIPFGSFNIQDREVELEWERLKAKLQTLKEIKKLQDEKVKKLKKAILHKSNALIIAEIYLEIDKIFGDLNSEEEK